MRTPTIRLLTALLATAVVATLLLVTNAALARREAQTRPVTAVLRELVPQRVTAADIVAIDLIDGTGRRIEFVREIDGHWRCVTGHGTLADPDRVNRLLARTLGGGGIVRTTDPSHAPRYGLDGPTAIRMVLQRRPEGWAPPEGGDEILPPPREVVLDLDIGVALRDVDQTFVRVRGSDEVIAMEADIRRELRPDGPGGLPMIDTHVVPTSWPGLRFVPRQIVVLRRGFFPFELRREDIVDDAGDVTGWRWLRRTGDADFEPAHEALPMMFVAFLSRARFIGIMPGEEAGAMGFDNPVGRVLLGSDFVEPMELRLAPPQEWGTPLYGSFARTVSIVSNDMARLMLPGPELFDPLMVENPWAAFTDRPMGLPPGIAPDQLPPGFDLPTAPPPEAPPRDDALFGPG